MCLCGEYFFLDINFFDELMLILNYDLLSKMVCSPAGEHIETINYAIFYKLWDELYYWDKLIQHLIFRLRSALSHFPEQILLLQFKIKTRGTTHCGPSGNGHLAIA